MKRARITGTGSYVPEKVLTNADLEKIVDTSDEWIASRTGIRERHIVADGQNTSDLATEAARQALEMAGIRAADIDLIIVGTVTGDYPWPATACLVQEKLGAKKAFAYDVSAACSGFVFALDAATRQIEAGAIQKALVIGAEVFSRILDWTDRNTCVLFGDGAGAVVVEVTDEDRGVLSSRLHSDGSYADLLYQPGFSTRNTATAENLDQKLQYIKMQGNEVFKVAVKMLSEVALEALEEAGLTSADMDLLIPHQANRRIIDATAKRLKLADDKVYVNVDRFGNTSAATIPIALNEVVRNGAITAGDILVFSAFGGGFAWGGTVVRW